MKVIFLDSSPLSVLSEPISTPSFMKISAWVNMHLAVGNRICIPEIVDYELRRELVRAGKIPSIAELDALKSQLDYIPLCTEAMIFAADLWAQSRNRGTPTGDPKRLDVDVILSAQAIDHGKRLGIAPADVIVATSNPKHLAQFIQADLWYDILP
jgi:predicted nucleic acid-binding protein